MPVSLMVGDTATTEMAVFLGDNQGEEDPYWNFTAIL